MPFFLKRECHEESPEQSAKDATDSTAVEQSRTFGFDESEAGNEGMGQQDSCYQTLRAAARA